MTATKVQKHTGYADFTVCMSRHVPTACNKALTWRRVVTGGVLDACGGRHEGPKVDMLALNGQVALAQRVEPSKLHMQSSGTGSHVDATALPFPVCRVQGCRVSRKSTLCRRQQALKRAL